MSNAAPGSLSRQLEACYTQIRHYRRGENGVSLRDIADSVTLLKGYPPYVFEVRPRRARDVGFRFTGREFMDPVPRSIEFFTPDGVRDVTLKDPPIFLWAALRDSNLLHEAKEEADAEQSS